uniref:ciliated left-right organizer ZP-N domains-containing protein n=1 Tax=Callospermophilus lateralis TaxID=76772 RepID=UPI00403851A0
MWGSPVVVWAICLICVQPAVFPQILTFWSNRDRPRPALEVSTAEVECFSDYMTLQIPSSHVQGLRRWLGRILHLPGSWRNPDRQDSLLVKCGYSLHPASGGDFVFRAQYSACSVRKEKASYRLEIRIFQKGVKGSKWSDGYIMKCPVVVSGLSQQSVHCGPTFIQVSRPLPLRSNSGQTPWLLSLRGELVASLEDANLMGLYVDINATSVTIQSPRQDVLQRQEVLNTSLEVLPLWLVSGHYAYSLEAACPVVSSQPETDVSVHIPKQRLGLVKRGSRIENSLNLKLLRVHQSDTFTVTESRDFVMVSIPAATLLQVQPCQQARGAPGTQAFYKVDLNLEFAEVAAPILWTVENVFQCMAPPGSPPSSPSPGLDTPPARVPSAASSPFQGAGPAAQERPLQGPVHWSSGELSKEDPGLILRTARPAGGSWASTILPLPRARQAVSPGWPPGRSDPPKVSLGSEQSVTEDPGPTRPKQDPTQPLGSPLLLGGDVASSEPLPGEPTQASRALQPLTRHLEARLAEETLVSRFSLKERSSVTGSKEPPQSGHGLSQERAGGNLGPLSPEPSQDMEGQGPTSLLGMAAIFTTPGEQQTDTRDHLEASEPESSEGHEVDPTAPLTALVESPLASSSEEPAVRAPGLESTPKWPVSWRGSGAAHMPSPSPLQTLSLRAPAETTSPPTLEPGNPFSANPGASLQWEPTEPTLATSPESHGTPGLQHGGRAL